MGRWCDVACPPCSPLWRAEAVLGGRVSRCAGRSERARRASPSLPSTAGGKAEAIFVEASNVVPESRDALCVPPLRPTVVRPKPSARFPRTRTVPLLDPLLIACSGLLERIDPPSNALPSPNRRVGHARRRPCIPDGQDVRGTGLAPETADPASRRHNEALCQGARGLAGA